MVRDEQILPPSIKFASNGFATARLSVSLRQPLFSKSEPADIIRNDEFDHMGNPVKTLKMRRINPAISWLAVVALALLFAGCAAVPTMYRHADLYLEWKANEFFDLDRAQENAIKPVIESVLLWHRQTELPAYSDLLLKVQAKLNGKVTLDDVHWLFDQMRLRTHTTVVKAAVESAPVLATVTPKQIAELQRRLAKENEDFIDKYSQGPMEKQQARRATRFIDNIEYWVGSLSDAQKTEIKQIAAQAPTAYSLQLVERQRVQGEFVILLNEKNSAEQLKARLSTWIESWDAGRSPQFVEALKASNDQLFHMALAIAETMTPTQRAHAQKMLQQYIDEIAALEKNS
jgi:hypothetical protein